MALDGMTPARHRTAEIFAGQFAGRSGDRGWSGFAAGARGVEKEYAAAGEVPAFELDEITIGELQDGMKSGKYTAHAITEKYLARIAAIDKSGPSVNSVIETNPDALEIAEALDKERKEKGPRGPLHGIPVLIKDNIATADRMQTTAGSLALVGSKPPRDAFIVQKLREAGAVILGKTNLSEWANIRSNHSISGWSGRGGQTKNPYALDRNPCGSSSGTGAGISSNFAAIGIGTETDGSIVCPSSANGLGGDQADGRAGEPEQDYSRFRIRRIRRDRCAARCGMRRFCWERLTGVDPDDSATAVSDGKFFKDYTQFLNADGLKGARIGVLRKAFGFNPAVDKLMEAALDAMKKQGAILVDPVEFETYGKFGETEFLGFMYELKADLNAYLAWLGPNTPVKTLEGDHRVQRQKCGEGDAVFWAGEFCEGRGKGAADDEGICGGDCEESRAGGQRGHRQDDGQAQARCDCGTDRRARRG